MINHDNTQDKSSTIMLIPGLNMHPNAMNDLASSLSKQGNNIFIHKHRYQTTPNQWANDFEKALLEIQPNYIIAHSLGAMLALNAFLENKLSCSMLLICPPLVLNKSTHYFLELITKFPYDFKVPSFNLKSYRVNGFTTNFDYQALHKLIKKITPQMEELKINSKIKLAYVDNDELVDSKRSLKLAGGTLLYKQGLGPNHLFIDRATCGEKSYLELLALL